MTDKGKDLTKNEDFYRQTMYKMWNEWLEEYKAMTPEEKAEHEEHMKYFMEQTGADEESNVFYMYLGFLAGVGKGAELS